MQDISKRFLAVPMVEHAGLDASLFALDPDEFIDACAQRLGLTETDFPDADRAFLRAALFAGKPRLLVIDAILRHKAPDGGRRDLVSPLAAVAQDSGDYLVTDLLIRFAPEDDQAFLGQVFATIVGRAPEEFERLPLMFDLRRKRVSREAVVHHLVERAQREGRVVRCTPVQTGGAAKPDGLANGTEKIGPGGSAGIDSLGRAMFSLCRRDARGGWDIDPAFIRQTLRVEDGIWHLRPGFVLAGPKAALFPGLWKITLELVQAEDAVVALDVVANSALDQIIRTDIVGSFDGSVAVPVGRHHHFVEVRLSKPPQEEPLMWLRMGRMLLTRVGDLPARQ